MVAETGEKLRLMVVDDEPAMCALLKQACEGEGHQVDVAESAERALQALSEQPADLVLTDLRMEGLSGIDLLRKLIERDPSTGVMLITGYATLDSALEAMRLGAIDVIQKPVNLGDLSRKIRDYARKRKGAATSSAEGKNSMPAHETRPSVEVQRAEPQPMRLASSSQEANSIDKILDIPVHATVRLGRATLQIADLLKLGTGSVIELDRHTGEPAELLVNNKLVALGEVVVVNDTFGLRITNIIDQKQRIQSLG
jgi:flagellar motor switch protein FliN